MNRYNIQGINREIGKYGKSITILAGVLLLNGIALHHIVKNGELITKLDEILKETIKNNKGLNDNVLTKLKKLLEPLKLDQTNLNDFIERIEAQYEADASSKPLQIKPAVKADNISGIPNSIGLQRKLDRYKTN